MIPYRRDDEEYNKFDLGFNSLMIVSVENAIEVINKNITADDKQDCGLFGVQILL